MGGKPTPGRPVLRSNEEDLPEKTEARLPPGKLLRQNLRVTHFAQLSHALDHLGSQ